MDLPRGVCLLSEKISDISQWYVKLPENFQGSVQIQVKSDSGSTIFDFLIEKGKLIAATFEDDALIWGLDALQKINDLPEGSECSIEVCSLSDLKIALARKANSQFLLKEPQIINVCSRAGLFGRFEFKDGKFENHSHGFPAYSASKYLQLITTIYMAEDFERHGIAINLVHPGDVATNIWQGESLLMKIIGPVMKKNLKTLEEGAIAGLHLIENRPSTSGGFYQMHGEKIEFKKYDEDKAKAIIDKVNEIIGFKGFEFEI